MLTKRKKSRRKGRKLEWKNGERKWERGRGERRGHQDSDFEATSPTPNSRNDLIHQNHVYCPRPATNESRKEKERSLQAYSPRVAPSLQSTKAKINRAEEHPREKKRSTRIRRRECEKPREAGCYDPNSCSGRRLALEAYANPILKDKSTPPPPENILRSINPPVPSRVVAEPMFEKSEARLDMLPSFRPSVRLIHGATRSIRWNNDSPSLMIRRRCWAFRKPKSSRGGAGPARSGVQFFDGWGGGGMGWVRRDTERPDRGHEAVLDLRGTALCSSGGWGFVQANQGDETNAHTCTSNAS